jgi:hypothetical protein
MGSISEQIKPQARSEGLVIQELSDEVLIYDLERDKAHCLNQSAAMIWKHCDGKTSISQLAQLVAKESGLPANEELVWLALEQLSKAQLLPQAVKRDTGKKPMTRREVIKRIGLGAAAAIPVVTSIVAPMAAQAATLKTPGSPCSAPAECSSGLCIPPLCA